MTHRKYNTLENDKYINRMYWNSIVRTFVNMYRLFAFEAKVQTQSLNALKEALHHRANYKYYQGD